jgi:hypothetical protein
MSVNITRAKGQLKRTTPTEDNVVCMIMSGAAVVGKIALAEPKQIFSTDDLVTLGITADNNPLAYQDILDFYATAGEGAELNFMLVVDTTSFADICDAVNDLGKKLLDSVNGRGVIFVVNRKAPVDYVPVIAAGLDADVNAAITKLNALAAAYQLQNIPFVGILPAWGFSKDTIADMPQRDTLANDYVALNSWCLKSDGIVSQGLLAGWLTTLQVHQNAGRVGNGKVSDTAFMPDGTEPKDLKYQWDTLAAKGLLFPIKIGGKSGYFFKDDPTLTSKGSDYSSISWNRTINKAQRIAYDVLVEKQNDDVDIDQSTGKIESTLVSDWESDVENEIRAQMMKVSATKQKEISGVKCSIDPNSDIVNDEIDATLTIVRKGQAKTINVKIGYAPTV